MLDDQILTVEHLKKVKEGYTDQFSLDFQLLMKECQCLERPPKPDFNSKPIIKTIQRPKSAAMVKQQRMKDYSFKISGFQREQIEINKPTVKNNDFDMSYKVIDRNFYGKAVASIQNQVQETVKEMQQYHIDREAQNSPMKAHYERQARVAEEKLLNEAVAKIKQKHSKTGHQGGKNKGTRLLNLIQC